MNYKPVATFRTPFLICQSKVLLPQTYVTLADIGYPVLTLYFSLKHFKILFSCNLSVDVCSSSFTNFLDQYQLYVCAMESPVKLVMNYERSLYTVVCVILRYFLL
jgi:hypothetical protein